MDRMDVNPSNPTTSLDGEWMSVERDAYEAMCTELELYRQIYGPLPATLSEATPVEAAPETSTEKSTTLDPTITLDMEASIGEPENAPKAEHVKTTTIDASQEILAILSQDESTLKATLLDDMEESLLAMSTNEVIRHYGFKRMKVNHR